MKKIIVMPSTPSCIFHTFQWLRFYEFLSFTLNGAFYTVCVDIVLLFSSNADKKLTSF